jgi:diguanylate cyclase (GGDEF)-like protein/PAS domain S-box-containing protein
MFQAHPFRRALRYAGAALCLTAVFEGLRQFILPHLSAGQSHLAAILVCGFVVFLLNLGFARRIKVTPETFPQNILENLPEMATIIGEGGRFKQWNSNVETTLGYTAEEIANITVFETIAEEERESLSLALAKTLTEGTSKVESVLVAKSGARIPCLLTGVRIDLNDSPYVLGIAVDLRKIRQAEESVLRLASIVECCEDAIASKNMDGVITSWNRAAEKMYGYTTEEVVGRNISLLLPSERQAEMQVLMERLRKGLPVECLETKRVSKTGTVLDVSVSISPVRDAGGRITGASTISRDISPQKQAESQLRLQSAALEAAANAILITDYEGTIVWVNPAFTTMTGYSKEEALGKNSRLLKSGEQSRAYYAELWSTISAGKVWKGEVVNRRKDGTNYAEEMTITPVTRDPHNPANRYFIAIKQDITERKHAEEALLFKTALLEAQAETTIDGILAVDEAGRIVLVNKQFGLHFGVPEEMLAAGDDHAVLEFVMAKVAAPEAFLERVNHLYSHPDERSRDEFRLTDGKVFDRYSAPLVDSKRRYRGRIWYFRDITGRRSAEEKLQFLAYYDALTRLPNRTLLQDRLAKALAGARRQKDKVALLFVDLDGFKTINDSLGHSVGDRILQEVAERLTTWAREQDTVARVGGDEFVIVLNGIKEVADAAVAAERIVNMMTAVGFVVEEHSLHVSCSIGVSIFPEHGEDCETLIRNADVAMYSAKENGRNNFKFFLAAMNAQVAERLTLENSLRQALAREELFLVYQPQLDIASEKISGLEALIRWQHPKLGLVPPDKFIRIAENSGLIVPIGEWVLRTACSQAKKWQGEGLAPVTVAVNVSAVQFRQEGFCDLVRRVLRETGLEPQYLELELTESLLLANAGLMLSVMQELKSMGVGLAIDDFGTGYSSFSYLRQFRVNKFKIDRSFIRDVAVDPDDAAIAAAIISMARSLRLKVIAEGVENEAQMSFLRAHGCDEIQGYYFSKPLAVDKVGEKLRDECAETPALAHTRGKTSPSGTA